MAALPLYIGARVWVPNSDGVWKAGTVEALSTTEPVAEAGAASTSAASASPSDAPMATVRPEDPPGADTRTLPAAEVHLREPESKGHVEAGRRKGGRWMSERAAVAKRAELTSVFPQLNSSLPGHDAPVVLE